MHRPRPRSRPQAADPDLGGEIPENAFISPDEPIRRAAAAEPDADLDDVGHMDEGALIPPDDPIVRTSAPTTPEDYAEVLGSWIGGDDVQVTGIGDDPHLSDEDILAIERFGDPHVADLFRALDRLTDAVRAKGQAGLKTSSDMTPFEISLRAYCVGYLAGRREEP